MQAFFVPESPPIVPFGGGGEVAADRASALRVQQAGYGSVIPLW